MLDHASDVSSARQETGDRSHLTPRPESYSDVITHAHVGGLQQGLCAGQIFSYLSSSRARFRYSARSVSSAMRLRALRSWSYSEPYRRSWPSSLAPRLDPQRDANERAMRASSVITGACSIRIGWL